MRDEVFDAAVSSLPNGATMYERSRGDLCARSHELKTVSAAWYVNENGRNHHEALEAAINSVQSEADGGCLYWSAGSITRL